MALIMTITDGTRTVNLASTDAYCLSFGMAAPVSGEEYATDNHEIEFFGGNSTVLTNMTKLNNLLEQARRYREDRIGLKVYITIQLDGATTYRSEIYQGKFESTAEMVNAERALGVRRGTLTVIRKNWWEGAEAQISLTNGNGTDNTAGLNVYNNGDATGSSPNKADNWFDILSTKIAGDLPAPIRFEMVHGGHQVTTTYIDVAMASGTIGTYSAWWTEAFSGWTQNNDTNRTNGYYYYATAPSTGLGDNISTYMNYFDMPGNYHFYAMLAASAGVTSKITPAFYNVISPTITDGRSQYLTLSTIFQLFDLGVLNFPSVDTPNTIVGNSKYLKFTNTAGIDIRLDYLESVRSDQFRCLMAGPIASAYDLIDDGLGYETAYYRANGGTSILLNVQTLGKQIMLHPGFNHRFYMNAYFNVASDTNAKRAYWTVKVYYRPRYLSI
jgi:hypothetical protein